MKRIFWTLGLMLATQAGLLAQGAQGGANTYRISGQLQNMQAARVYLIYYEKGKEVLDSAAVTNGRYVLTGKMTTEGQSARLQDVSFSGAFSDKTPPGNIARIFLIPESFSITHIDSFSNPVITGSVVNADYRQLMQDLKPYQEQEKSLFSSGTSATQPIRIEMTEPIKAKLKVISKEVENTLYAPYVRQHPHSPMAIFVLKLYVENDLEPDMAVVQTLFDGLSPAVRTSAGGKEIAKMLADLSKTAIGKKVMDFTQKDTLGKPVRLSAFRGRYVLLDFWASWCAPCRKENPNLVSAYNKYRPKGFDILSVSLDNPGDKDKWLEAIHKDGLTWTNVSDLRGWHNAVAVEYGVESIPTNFLIDPQGKIAAKGLHGDELEKKLNEIYKN